MSTQTALDILKLERSKLDQAIRLLEGDTGTGRRMGRLRKSPDDPTMPDWVSGNITANKPKRKSRKFTRKQREQQSAFMKAQWAKRKKAAAGKAGGKKKAKTGTVAG